MVLLHGWGSTSRMRRFAIRRLAQAGYTVLAPDLRGVGGAGRFASIIGDHLRHVAGDVRVATMEGAGHRVAEEQPDAAAQALLPFLAATT